MYSGIVLVFLVVYDLVPLSSAHGCPKDFQCGNIGNLRFPFTDYAQPNCGLIMANCSDQTSPEISLGQQPEERWYRLINGPFNGGNFIRVLDQSHKDQRCASFSFMNTVHQASSDAISITVEPNITVIKCNEPRIEPFMGLMKYNACHDFTIYYKNPKEDGLPNPLSNIPTLPPDCRSITLPMAPLDSIDEKSGLFDLFAPEFDLSWNLSDKCVECMKVNGNRCTTDDAGRFFCSKQENNKWKLVVSLASVITSVLAAAFCFVMIRRRGLKGEKRSMKDDYIHQTFEKGIQDAPGVKILSFEAILTATDNFSNDNKLGQGGYGPVYKGKLSDGREIAVKRLSKTSGQGLQEFKSELILISKLQHTNLVRLYGCCIHQEEKILIYEFMPNKSLDFFLFGMYQHQIPTRFIFQIPTHSMWQNCNFRPVPVFVFSPVFTPVAIFVL